MIPHNIQGRVWFKQEETFGDPMDDPNISTDPDMTENDSEPTVASVIENRNWKEVSVIKIHLKFIINQLTGLIF